MPGRNGTGPLGRGAVKGRGLGTCIGAGLGVAMLGRRAMDRGLRCAGVGVNACRYGAGLFDRGMNMAGGLGLGRGFGRNYESQTTDPQIQKELLQKQKSQLEDRLEYINQQLEQF